LFYFVGCRRQVSGGAFNCRNAILKRTHGSGKQRAGVGGILRCAREFPEPLKLILSCVKNGYGLIEFAYSGGFPASVASRSPPNDIARTVHTINQSHTRGGINQDSHSFCPQRANRGNQCRACKHPKQNQNRDQPKPPKQARESWTIGEACIVPGCPPGKRHKPQTQGYNPPPWEKAFQGKPGLGGRARRHGSSDAAGNETSFGWLARKVIASLHLGSRVNQHSGDGHPALDR
jgi:hypothetical protein